MLQPLLSIVSPVYKANSIVPELVSRIVNAVSEITDNYEVILVDDGCPENSWEAIAHECNQDKRIKGIKLSRNFGQHYAITAGLDAVQGEWVVVMDCDLQDQPEEINRLYEKASEGFDVVFGLRNNRQDNLFRRGASKLFYRILSYLTDTKQDGLIANFGIYHQKVILAILQMKDRLRYFPTMCRWVGFKQTSINISHSVRTEGVSSYNFKLLMRLAMNNMFAFSEKPLWLMIRIGGIIAFFSFLIGFVYFVKYLFGEITEPGFTTLIMSIWFLSGMLMLMIGIVGVYVGKTFEASKERPLFIIEKQLNR
jgi:glycosyltransferase involved in cell wall biosynthesis